MYKYLVISCLLLAQPGLAQPAGDKRASALPVEGSAACQFSDNGGCHIAWNFPTRDGRQYWIEEMHPDTSRWQRVSGSLPAHAGATGQPLPGGRLYRVVACDDDVPETASCTGSEVVWVIEHAKTVDAIPEIVYTQAGLKMYVGKSLRLEEQEQQYNVYLLYRLLDSLSPDELTALPPMAPPRFGPEVPPEELLAQASIDEITENVLFGQYETARTGQALPYPQHSHTH